jgi:hypothetical protein
LLLQILDGFLHAPPFFFRHALAVVGVDYENGACADNFRNVVERGYGVYAAAAHYNRFPHAAPSLPGGKIAWNGWLLGKKVLFDTGFIASKLIANIFLLC